MTEAVPAGFGPLPRLSPYIAAMGPFYVKSVGDIRTLGLVVLEKHINTRGFVHGGFLCSMADIAIGYQIAMGYFLSFECYQLGNYFFFGAAFGAGQLIAFVLAAAAAWLVLRPAAKAAAGTLAAGASAQ